MMGLDSRHAPSLDLPARFMALAIVSFLLAMMLAPFALPDVQEGFGRFSSLAYVHLLTLGFAGSMLIGASYQLVPVVVGRPLWSVALGRASFWAYLAGLVVFLGALLREWVPGLGIGGTLLGVAFAAYIAVVGVTIASAPSRDVVAWHLVAGLVAAGAGMTLGVLLAFNKGSGTLGGDVLGYLGAHILVMLAGWAGITFVGVAYRLIGMFTLAEKHLHRRMAWVGLALLTGGTTVLALRFAAGVPAAMGQAGAMSLLAGTILFAMQLRRIYARRLRRTFDIHMPFAILAAIAGVVATGSLALGVVVGFEATSTIWMATTWLALVGFIATAIQGFFYKISTFLVWLKRYAPLAGTRPVPRLEELYDARLARAGFVVWTVGMVAGWLALLADTGLMAWVGVALLLGTMPFLANVVLIARHWVAGRWQAPSESAPVLQQRPFRG